MVIDVNVWRGGEEGEGVVTDQPPAPALRQSKLELHTIEIPKPQLMSAVYVNRLPADTA